MASPGAPAGRAPGELGNGRIVRHRQAQHVSLPFVLGLFWAPKAQLKVRGPAASRLQLLLAHTFTTVAVFD